jgi:hypothetical protein
VAYFAGERNLKVAVCSVAFLVLMGACVHSPTPAPAPVPCRPRSLSADSVAACHFYRQRDFGNEVQFNPLTEILNEGFDQLRVDNSDRRIGKLRFRAGAHNVIQALLHPDSAMRSYGVRKAITDELLPLSTKASNGGNWVPNYEFHLLGSGMVSERMVEWFEAHDVGHPVAASFVTMFTAHFINEALEDGGRPIRGHAFDPVADLYVFDLGGFLLFRSARVQRLFSERLELTNWAGQATIGMPGLTLENAGQEFLLRTRLPRTDRYRAFFAFGYSTLGGISIGKKGGLALSLAAGVDAIDTPVVDSASGKKTVTLKPNSGVFVDRDGVLLFSLTARYSNEVIAMANLYPGVVRFGGVSFGSWVQLTRDHKWRFGIVPEFGVGLGRSSVR